MTTFEDARVPEGAGVHFDAIVLAREGNPVYEPGELMHGIGVHFLQDTTPPEIVEHTLEVQPNGVLDFRVGATDSFTEFFVMAAAASITLSVNGGEQVVLPMDFDDPAFIDGLTRFQVAVGPFPPESTIDFEITVTDELGNLAVTGGRTEVQ